jgi:hypothetical protein
MLEFFEVVAHTYMWSSADDQFMVVYIAVGSLVIGSILGRDPKPRRRGKFGPQAEEALHRLRA